MTSLESEFITGKIKESTRKRIKCLKDKVSGSQRITLIHFPSNDTHKHWGAATFYTVLTGSLL